ncbi:MAG: RluA family pseudouridine synthase [Rhodospirillaceae bacterium]|nr:RluA family pseudouridine synthase [Rhodospirillaceae bacterium]
MTAAISASDQRRFEVDPDAAGERLDRWLASQNEDVSRSRIQQLIAQGHVRLDGEVVPASTAVRSGQVVTLTIPPPAAVTLAAQKIPLDIVFEDKHLIVVNKPAGLVVHPAAGNPDNTLVNALLAHCGDTLLGIGGELRPGIVHRLDKDTSGLLVAAKSGEAHAHLAEQFAVHSIARAYDAVVWGSLRPSKGIVKGQIGRSTTDRKKMAVKTSGGKYAETHYALVENFGAVAAWVECVLKTGRTHQIRVHMASLGHPLIGDATYSSVRSKFIKELDDDAASVVRNFPRQALHARLLGFIHPISGKKLKFEQKPPEDFQSLAKALRSATQKPAQKVTRKKKA